MLSDEVKKTFLFERYFWIFVKLFVEVVLILVVIILNFKSLYPNIDTKQKKFKKMGNFFIVAIKKHPKTSLLQD